MILLYIASIVSSNSSTSFEMAFLVDVSSMCDIDVKAYFSVFTYYCLRYNLPVHVCCSYFTVIILVSICSSRHGIYCFVQVVSFILILANSILAFLSASVCSAVNCYFSILVSSIYLLLLNK